MPIFFTSLDLLTNPGRWAGIINSILWMRHQVPTGEGSCLKARTRTQVFTIPISGPEVIFGGTVRSFEISLDKGVEDYLCWMSQVIHHLFSLMTGEIFPWSENPQVRDLGQLCSYGRFQRLKTAPLS